MKYVKLFETQQDKEQETLFYPNLNYVISTDTLSIEASAPVSVEEEPMPDDE